jgi:hypothetical protein
MARLTGTAAGAAARRNWQNLLARFAGPIDHADQDAAPGACDRVQFPISQTRLFLNDPGALADIHPIPGPPPTPGVAAAVALAPVPQVPLQTGVPADEAVDRLVTDRPQIVAGQPTGNLLRRPFAKQLSQYHQREPATHLHHRPAPPRKARRLRPGGMIATPGAVAPQLPTDRRVVNRQVPADRAAREPPSVQSENLAPFRIGQLFVSHRLASSFDIKRLRQSVDRFQTHGALHV